jgi:superoxide dismutase, Fe-Mn family
MFQVPPLKYAFDALEPHIDARTMEIHHDKHHAAYVNNLNKALEAHPELQGKTIEELISDLAALPAGIQTAVRNNGGGHYNHSLFWDIMGPNGGAPSGDLLAAINAGFGSLDKMKEAVNAAGAGRFGSGWAWVIKNGDKLEVTSTPNQDSPVMEGKKAILGVDVWEHAYYLNYQNRRPDYLAAWWNTVAWDKVAARLAG